MPYSCSTETLDRALSQFFAQSENSFDEVAQQALRAVIERRPQIAYLINEHGHKYLHDYSKELIPVDDRLSESAKKVFTDLIHACLPKDLLPSLSDSLSSLFTIDTSSHGGILSEDCSLQGHMIIADGAKNNEIPLFLSLACGVVPMNNATWPRGFYFDNKRFSIFSKQLDRVAVHECAPLTPDILKKKINDAQTPSEIKQFLEWILQKEKIFELNSFAIQAAYINSALWNEHLKNNGPSCAQLPLEAVTSALVINSLNKNDALARFIFCSSMQNEIISELADLPGTWSTDRSKGTFLFWHKSGDFRAASLFLENGSLTGQGISIPFEKDAIIEKLIRGEIVPSVFLSLVSLLHNGVRPLGGYHQSWYLPLYREKLTKILSKKMDETCPSFLASIQCEDLIQLGYGLAFYQSNKSSGLAGLETFFDNPNEVSNAYAKLSTTTVAEAIRKPLARWYAEIVPAHERKIPLETLA